MYQFKTDIKLVDHKDDDIVYTPERSAWYDLIRKYTKSDFIALCNGDIDNAQLLLDRLEWQHPETLLEEDKMFND